MGQRQKTRNQCNAAIGFQTPFGDDGYNRCRKKVAIDGMCKTHNRMRLAKINLKQEDIDEQSNK